MNVRARQRGLSIVELLVGVAIGLFIAATGTTLMAGHLRESRGLLIEARLMQDLRTASDLITRDLRRAGAWGASTGGVWAPGVASVSANPYVAIAPAIAASDAASFRYTRDATENNTVDSNEQFGYRLRNGAIELQIGAGAWQALTDTGTLTVTAFTVTPIVESIDLSGACGIACTGATCPRQQVRRLDVLIRGQSATDASVRRQLAGSVRLRNDVLTGACPA